MPSNERTVSNSERNDRRSFRLGPGSSKQHSVPASSPGGGPLRLPPGEADIEALRSVTREWLVPRLVEKFLRVHGFELKHSRKIANTANRLQLSLSEEGPLVSGNAARKRSQTNKKTTIEGLQ